MTASVKKTSAEEAVERLRDEFNGKVMLHACCGPCSLEPVHLFLDAGIDFAIDFTNPNIHPEDEYDHRKETLREFVCDAHGIELFEGAYDVDAWKREAGVHGVDREKRCRACYRLRFREAAAHAAERGFNALCTTLTISPYQYTQMILEELGQAAESQGLKALAIDFHEHYWEATRIAYEKGMYRQNYCGCTYSIAEAQQQREQFKRQREITKAKRLQARMIAAAEGSVRQASQL